MDYKLVKQLKEAGWINSENWIDKGKYFEPKIGTDLEFPTLSELIEACGMAGYNPSEIHGESLGKPFFCELTAVIGFSKKGGWRAKGAIHAKITTLGYKLEEFDEYGDTPEEAVAKLWLKLNDK